MDLRVEAVYILSGRGMRRRCNNPNDHKYPRYGGRGISVCREWDRFEVFREWALASGWQRGLQINRIDNNGDYCPENCNFVTNQQNCRNRSTNIELTVNGQTMILIEWCEHPDVKDKVKYQVLLDFYRKYGKEDTEGRILDMLHGMPFMQKRGVYFTIDGKTMRIREWAEKCGINLSALEKWYSAKGKDATIERIQQHLQGVRFHRNGKPITG